MGRRTHRPVGDGTGAAKEEWWRELIPASVMEHDSELHGNTYNLVFQSCPTCSWMRRDCPLAV